MQPTAGMKVIFRNAPTSVFTICRIVKIHDPQTGQDLRAFHLDLSSAVYFADRFAEEFLVVLEEANE